MNPSESRVLRISQLVWIRTFLGAALLSSSCSDEPQSTPEPQSPIPEVAMATIADEANLKKPIRRQVIVPQPIQPTDKSPVSFINYPFDEFLKTLRSDEDLIIVVDEPENFPTITLGNIPRNHLVPAFELYMQLRGYTVIKGGNILVFLILVKTSPEFPWERPFKERFKKTLTSLDHEIEVSIDWPNFPLNSAATEIGLLTNRSVVLGPGLLGMTISPSAGQFDDLSELLEYFDAHLQKDSICMHEVGEHFLVFERIRPLSEIISPIQLPSATGVDTRARVRHRRQSVQLPESTHRPSLNPSSPKSGEKSEPATATSSERK